MDADLSDREIDGICDGYVQNAAKIRYLRAMGLTVRTKPSGRPLVNRNHYDAVTNGNANRATDGPKWGSSGPNWSPA